ncbi:hypothetical protein SARC_11221 [Sphaeroforma arctica JP610]|uniref:Uncharacterized protein n=1 Tax=Sphaeroforma arctica JP610 TaxID=667725 RepID=A0A0L0FIG5_9EUKA|nr:hypothetical protein SARC_11221 [Sphaeroforma arctica JP610]KNC76271.1 hypothetical protein SARC_11221 [Sphaeroforma arctica JP610]|eukprot:XP_014150173.1 hypothetical protein SARC_11221 [Sphaeroforma arctica JP610]
MSVIEQTHQFPPGKFQLVLNLTMPNSSISFFRVFYYAFQVSYFGFQGQNLVMKILYITVCTGEVAAISTCVALYFLCAKVVCPSDDNNYRCADNHIQYFIISDVRAFLPQQIDTSIMMALWDKDTPVEAKQ